MAPAPRPLVGPSSSRRSRSVAADREAEHLHPGVRRRDSARKIRPPFELDPTLCLYSPQSNLDALEHPRVIEWRRHVVEDWLPTPVPGAERRLALLLPCTKYKPYVTSREHRSINTGLAEAGWRPTEPFAGPAPLLDVLDDGESPELLSVAPLRRGDVVIDRFVVSEPLALVPYQEMMEFGGSPSPASAYDDPGLFEQRGTSVSPERPDFSATRRSDGTWSWGPLERAAYVEVHNAMADTIAAVLGRLAPHYDAFVAWSSPGLTHRSFLADAAFRADDGLPTARRGPDGPLPLRGALDTLATDVAILPTAAQTAQARERLAARLAAEGRPAGDASVRAVYARGDGNDTPLGLPELVDELVAHLESLVAAA